MSIKKLFTKEDIVKELEPLDNKYFEFYEFENLSIAKECFFENLNHPVRFIKSDFNDVNFNEDFVNKISFHNAALTECAFLEKPRDVHGIIQKKGSLFFKDCLLTNFLWETIALECVDFDKCIFFDSVLVFHNKSNINVVGCTFVNTIFDNYDGLILLSMHKPSSLFQSTFTNCDIRNLSMSDHNYCRSNTFINCINEYLNLSAMGENKFIDMILLKPNVDIFCENTFINVVFIQGSLENCNMSKSVFKNCDMRTSSVYGLTLPEAYKNEIRLTDEQLKHITFV